MIDLRLKSRCPDDTAALARRLACRLRPGDCLLLEGGIGAGKTHFARAAIQSILTEPEEVPSPTFTLTQIYDSPLGEIWHADLYRLSSTAEIHELGLEEAFDTAVCLVEWPDRLGHPLPPRSVSIAFSPIPGHPEQRKVRIHPAGSGGDHLMNRLADA